MPFRYIVPLAVVIALALAAGMARSPLPAEASFHCNRIHEVMAGANGDASIQYVEIKMVIDGQNFLTGGSVKLVFFDAAGNQTGMFTFPSDAPSTMNHSMLVGTANFALNSTIPPDYTMPANIMAPDGKVQLVGTNRCIGLGTIIDSVAYGSYTGSSTQPPAMPAPVDCPPLPAAPMGPATALPIAGTQALTLGNNNSTCSNNSTEYSLMDVSTGMAYGNNAGAMGHICSAGPCPTPSPTPVPTPTPTATATPTPTPTPAPGDADSDTVPDATDNCPNWPNTSQMVPSWGVPAGDPDCDGFPSTVMAGMRGAEAYLGTVQDRQCAVDATPNNENPDSWPMDNNDDKKAGLADILAYIPFYLTNVPPSGPRLDLNEDGKIGLGDILTFIPFYLTSCSP
jgi:hypothetical protein